MTNKLISAVSVAVPVVIAVSSVATYLEAFVGLAFAVGSHIVGRRVTKACRRV